MRGREPFHRRWRAHAQLRAALVSGAHDVRSGCWRDQPGLAVRRHCCQGHVPQVLRQLPCPRTSGFRWGALTARALPLNEDTTIMSVFSREKLAHRMRRCSFGRLLAPRCPALAPFDVAPVRAHSADRAHDRLPTFVDCLCTHLPRSAGLSKIPSKVAKLHLQIVESRLEFQSKILP